MSRPLDGLKATLNRHGRRLQDRVDPFGAKPAEIKALMAGMLDPVRSAPLQDRMLAAGLPI